VDLNTVAEVVSPAAAGQWRPGDAWLGGGTALFGEPHPELRRLLDLTTAGWEPLVTRPQGLEIAATCTIATLAGHGHELFELCCHAFLASFKIWNVATVGGNLCASLPAGPMISLGAALDGECTILGPSSSRTVPVESFVTGEGANALRDGELLRSMTLPWEALHSATAFRQGSLHPYGRSAALLIGRRTPSGGFVLTVTASTKRPYVLRFGALPSAEMVQVALAERIPDAAYVRDVHGLPAWRRHLTRMYAEEIRAELSDGN
jgi:CO/xanthine dehydrogenase FAD-binding subunit